MPAHQQTVTACQCQARNPGRTRHATRRGQSEGLGLRIEIARHRAAPGTAVRLAGSTRTLRIRLRSFMRPPSQTANRELHDLLHRLRSLWAVGFAATIRIGYHARRNTDIR